MINIQPVDEVFTKFNDMKMKQAYRYLIFKSASDEKSIILDKEGSRDSTYDAFLKELPENEPRYCVFDYHHKYDDGRETNKIIYIFWSPDTAKVKQKMVAATANPSFSSKLESSIQIQANDFSGLDEKDVIQKRFA